MNLQQERLYAMTLAPDKLLHFLVSFIIAVERPVLAFLAGIGKEVYDAASSGMADAGDLVADWAGILFALWWS